MDTEQAHLARLDVVGDHGELLGRSLAHLSDEDAVYRLILDTIDSAKYKVLTNLTCSPIARWSLTGRHGND